MDHPAVPPDRPNPVGVSIIVPVYNAHDDLDACVASLRCQTHADLDLIFVNDGSTDSSGDKLDAYAAADDRIRVFHVANGGASKARNIGIRAATGIYVLFVDSDDTITPDAVAKLVARQQETGAALTIGAYHKVFDNRSAVLDLGGIAEDTVLEGDTLIDQVRLFMRAPHIHTLLSHCWGRLYLTEILHGGVMFDEELAQLEDVDINFRYLERTGRVAYTAAPLYNHTIRTARVTNMTARMGGERAADQRFFRAYESIRRFLRAHPAASVSIDVDRAVGHLYITTVVLAVIRLCRTLRPGTIAAIHRSLAAFAGSPLVRRNLKFYTPGKGDSREIPLALRTGLASLVLVAGWWRCRSANRQRRLGRQATEAAAGTNPAPTSGG